MTTRTIRTKSAILHLLTSILTSEQVEAIDEVNHAVAVHTIVAIDRTAFTGERTSDVALIAKDVVHLEAQRGRTLEEGLRELCVPNQLVAVHRGIGITTTALIGNVGGKRHAPGHHQLRVGTIREVVGRLIVFRTELVLLPRIGDATVDAELKPVVAIGSIQSLTQRKVGRGVLLLNMCLRIGQIGHIVAIAGVTEGVDGVLLVGQGSVEAEDTESIPVAVDVLGRSGPSTGFFIIYATVADAILRRREVEVRHDASLGLRIVGIVEEE